MPLEVVLSARAAQDLVEIDSLFAGYGLTATENFLAGIRTRCARFAEFPQAGRLRPEIGAGLRSFAVPGRATVLYRANAQTLRIVRAFYAGRNVQAMKAKDIDA